MEPKRFAERKLVIMLSDTTGFTRLAARSADLDVAALLDEDYGIHAEAITAHGGRVVKFMGDACLAVFPEDRAVAAVDCAGALRVALVGMYARHAHRVELGVNIHLATVAEGLFGRGDEARYDIVGAGVNHTFTMGSGAGLRLSEPVYRQLPNERRGAFRKHKPPALYTARDFV